MNFLWNNIPNEIIRTQLFCKLHKASTWLMFIAILDEGAPFCAERVQTLLREDVRTKLTDEFQVCGRQKFHVGQTGRREPNGNQCENTERYPKGRAP